MFTKSLAQGPEEAGGAIMITAEWALGVSFGSLCVSIAVALLLRRWFGEGVRLSMTVMADAKFIGGGTQDKNTYIAITVTNRGTATTTITYMVLYNYLDRLSHSFKVSALREPVV